VQSALHWQAAGVAAAALWQPQVQDVPGQVSQVQVVAGGVMVWADMIDSSGSGELPS